MNTLKVTGVWSLWRTWSRGNSYCSDPTDTRGCVLSAGASRADWVISEPCYMYGPADVKDDEHTAKPGLLIASSESIPLYQSQCTCNLNHLSPLLLVKRKLEAVCILTVPYYRLEIAKFCPCIDADKPTQSTYATQRQSLGNCAYCNDVNRQLSPFGALPAAWGTR